MPPPARPCAVFRLGCVEFDAAWQIQNRLAAGDTEALLFLEHPHTYTMGRQANPAHLLWDAETLRERSVSVRHIDRGGDITYHGPGQAVVYPILRLGGQNLKTDYVGYVRGLEQAIILALLRLGVAAAQRPGLTGVWVPADAWAKCTRCDPRQKPQPAKIASIGVKVDARGVTRHGFALNIDTDPLYWQGIVPCGLTGVQMVNLSDLLREPPSLPSVQDALQSALAEVFGLTLIQADPGFLDFSCSDC